MKAKTKRIVWTILGVLGVLAVAGLIVGFSVKNASQLQDAMDAIKEIGSTGAAE